MSTTPSPGSAVPAGDEAELQKLRRIRRRCPKFYGVRLSPDGIHWTAAVRCNGRENVLGTEYESEQAAWAAYKAAPKYYRRELVEDDGKVEALLALAGRFPVQFSVEASLHGSSLNLHHPDWQRAVLVDHYETSDKKR